MKSKRHNGGFQTEVARAFNRFCAERGINQKTPYDVVTLHGLGRSHLTVRPQAHNFGDGHAPLLLPDEVNPW